MRPRCATLALSTLKGAVRRYRQVQERRLSQTQGNAQPDEA